MPELAVAVTQKVLDQLAAGNAFQSQIAVTDPTGALVGQVGMASAKNQITIWLGGVVPLVLGDSGAFWRVHQNDPTAYDLLFRLLALHPDQKLRFTW